jgi:hypothetical protein
VYTTAFQVDLQCVYTPIERRANLRQMVEVHLPISMVSIALCLYMSEDDSLLERDTYSSLFGISMVAVAVLSFVLNNNTGMLVGWDIH